MNVCEAYGLRTFIAHARMQGEYNFDRIRLIIPVFMHGCRSDFSGMQAFTPARHRSGFYGFHYEHNGCRDRAGPCIPGNSTNEKTH